jgi:hypothetical protein
VVDGSEQQCSIPTKKKIKQSFYSGKKKHSITLLAVVAPKNGYIYWLYRHLTKVQKQIRKCLNFLLVSFGKISIYQNT